MHQPTDPGGRSLDPPRPTRLPSVVGAGLRHQVAFFGPLGVGKSTALHSASSIPVTGTEASWSLASRDLDPQMGDKTTTTVGIEYGEWHPDDGPPVALYGTPGQMRFAEVRRAVMMQPGGFVLWLFGNLPTALEDAASWLTLLEAGALTRGRLAVAVTRLSSVGPVSLADVADVAAGFDPGIPVLPADPRLPGDVHALLRSLIGGAR